MKVYTVSEKTNCLENENIDNINIFCQFFIHPNTERQLEILKCLKFNVSNPFITNIYLLNERIYTEEELGLSSDKIIQIDIQNRLKFKNVFKYINENNIQGYNIIINSDIFFDESINCIFKSDIHINKKMYALVRYEYDENDIQKSQIFGDGNRGDSQDTWIIHSTFSLNEKESKIFDFEFGKPGCDNKVTYLMSVLGFEILNDPEFIKTYHIHNSNIRNYTSSDKISSPYECVLPANSLIKDSMYYNVKYNHKHSNIKLYEYLTNKIQKNQHFIIPRIAGIENTFAIFTNLLLNVKINHTNHKDILEYLLSNVNILKNNAGINVSSINSMNKYSQMYLEAFINSEMYAIWAPFDSVYDPQTHQIIGDMLKNKQTIYSEVFDIYHHIYTRPWTHALENKRILIISAFEESIKPKINTRKDIYGIDLFPHCEIITIKPPQTQGLEDSEEFHIELNKFTDKLDFIKDNYDIALVSCGGYGNLVCSHIYKSGKSAIYVGGVLQMYWGILGTRWFNDRPEIIKLFLNKSWTMPKNCEKPTNFNSIENGCYW
jgi:hypothetical protein